jgi:hypothetical protein
LTGNEDLYTHAKVSDNARRVVFLAFMHQDGIGSSRLLLTPEWNEAFPNGYYLALPDRSCGLLIPHGTSATDIADTQQLVESMYDGVTVPMFDQLYTSADFALPAAWITPPATQSSQALLEAIAQLTAP